MTNDFVNSDSGTPTSLLRNVVAQEPGAWDVLVELFGPVVYGWLRRWQLQPADAEAVGNEVFVGVSRSIADFQRERRGAFHGWLWTITRRKFVDHLRDREKLENAPGGTSWHDLMQQVPEEIDEQTNQQTVRLIYQRVIALIQREFNPTHVDAFRLAAVEGHSAEEVAAQLQTTKTVVYNAVARIRKRVREEFGDLLDDSRE